MNVFEVVILGDDNVDNNIGIVVVCGMMIVLWIVYFYIYKNIFKIYSKIEIKVVWNILRFLYG